MNQCACGRPLWDGMETCEFCVSTGNKRDRRFRRAAKLDKGLCSGNERVTLRKQLANIGRGYEQ